MVIVICGAILQEINHLLTEAFLTLCAEVWDFGSRGDEVFVLLDRPMNDMITVKICDFHFHVLLC